MACLALASVALAAGVRPGGGGFGAGQPPAQADDAFLIHVLNRTSYGPTPATLSEIREVGVEEFLRRQLHPEDIDDSEVGGYVVADLPDPSLESYQWNELYYEHLLRARYSRRQLQEIMVQFWENHFDTVVVRGNNDPERHMWTMMEWRENRDFRNLALGRFRDLLEASAKSQAMMYFLDNYRSSVFTLNENYARELLELHSLGVDCGYGQSDVEEVARIFTGWTGVDLPGVAPDPARDTIEGTFLFRAAAHDARPKSALGVEFPAGGMLDEGELVLDIVSEHPCTARFIGRKLLEVFVSDDPSDELVDRIAGVFMTSDGDIRRVLQAIFDSPEFRDPANFEAKVKTPIEYTISALRATDAFARLRADGAGQRELYNLVRLQGMELFDFPIPTGYEEKGGDWISGNSLLQRWKFSDRMAFWRPAAPPDPANLNRPTYIEPTVVVTERGMQSPEAVVDHFSLLLAGADVDASRKEMLVDLLTDGTGVLDPAWPGAQENRLREMIAQLLGYPEANLQ